MAGDLKAPAQLCFIQFQILVADFNQVGNREKRCELNYYTPILLGKRLEVCILRGSIAAGSKGMEPFLHFNRLTISNSYKLEK
jgi:hypothetical protein